MGGVGGWLGQLFLLIWECPKIIWEKFGIPTLFSHFLKGGWSFLPNKQGSKINFYLQTQRCPRQWVNMVWAWGVSQLGYGHFEKFPPNFFSGFPRFPALSFEIHNPKLSWDCRECLWAPPSFEIFEISPSVLELKIAEGDKSWVFDLNEPKYLQNF